MKLSKRLIPVVLFASLSAGCLTADQISTLQKDVEEVKAKVEQVRAAQQKQAEETKELRAKIEGSAGGEQERRADIELRLKSLDDQIRTLSQKTDESARRVESLASEVSSLRAGPGGRNAAQPLPPAPAGPDASAARTAGGTAGEQELFNAAYADYSKGSYALAIKGFEDFLRRYGSANLADNARYWIGVSYYDSGDYEHAIQEFDRLLAEYPNGDKVPGAHLKKGLAYLEMNKTAQGVVQLQYLVEHYPNSDEARVARERLKSMGLRAD